VAGEGEAMQGSGMLRKIVGLCTGLELRKGGEMVG